MMNDMVFFKTNWCAGDKVVIFIANKSKTQ